MRCGKHQLQRQGAQVAREVRPKTQESNKAGDAPVVARGRQHGGGRERVAARKAKPVHHASLYVGSVCVRTTCGRRRPDAVRTHTAPASAFRLGSRSCTTGVSRAQSAPVCKRAAMAWELPICGGNRVLPCGEKRTRGTRGGTRQSQYTPYNRRLSRVRNNRDSAHSDSAAQGVRAGCARRVARRCAQGRASRAARWARVSPFTTSV